MPAPTTLTSQDVDQRIEDLAWKARAEPHDVALLCEALRHTDRRVMLRAAGALGRFGDETALLPLTTALREQVGGSGRLMVATGGVLVLLLGITLFVPAGLTDRLPLLVTLPGLIELVVHNRRRGHAARVLSEALADLSGRVQAPDLWKVAPALHRVSRDLIQQTPTTRAGIRTAALRIEQQTRDLRVLPVIATERPERSQELPRPVHEPSPPGAEGCGLPDETRPG
ncbi:MAG: hypothetical protein K0Q72_4550 [Armatimonadetes bacterium]|jgi:hypothetical protein|nr:hypothetical protein [Armatimonadota bacterium]